MGFYKGKLAKNEPKIRHFFKFDQNSPKNDTHVKQESNTPFLGIDNDKKWSPFLDLGVQSPIILYPKSLKMAVFGLKKGTSDAKIQKRRPLFVAYYPQK